MCRIWSYLVWNLLKLRRMNLNDLTWSKRLPYLGWWLSAKVFLLEIIQLLRNGRMTNRGKKRKKKERERGRRRGEGEKGRRGGGEEERRKEDGDTESHKVTAINWMSKHAWEQVHGWAPLQHLAPPDAADVVSYRCWRVGLLLNWPCLCHLSRPPSFIFLHFSAALRKKGRKSTRNPRESWQESTRISLTSLISLSSLSLPLSLRSCVFINALRAFRATGLNHFPFRLDIHSYLKLCQFLMCFAKNILFYIITY